MLTTSAYGARATRAEASCARADAQRWRARLRGKPTASTRCSTPTPTAGSPHPLSRVIVPEPLALAWAPFARSRALRAAPRAPLRLRDHHLAAGVGARRRAARCAAAASPGSPTSATPGPSSRCGPPFPTGAQRRLDERARAPLARRRRRGRLRRRARRPTTCAGARHRRPGADPQRLGPRARLARGRPSDVAGLLDPERVSLVYTGRFGSYGRDPRAAGRGARAGLRASDPAAAARLELVIAGPLTDDEAELFARRRLPGADRRSPAACRASARSRCSARPTRCC